MSDSGISVIIHKYKPTSASNNMKKIILGALFALIAVNVRAGESAVLEAASPQNKTAWHIIKSDDGKTVLTNDIAEVNAYEVRRVAANQAAIDDLRKKQRELASKPDAAIGMTAAQVKNNTSWGSPRYVKTTTTKHGTREQWVYEDYQYLYFDNGKLTTIQQ